MRKLIITVAPTGSLTTREQLPWIPVTPREIADAAVEAYQAGAAIVHIHVRDPVTGEPAQEQELYRETIDYIREDTAGKMIICTTTGGRATMGATPEERMCSLDLQPELASLNVNSMNFGPRIFPNPPDVVELFAQTMKDKGIKPEVECYDIGHVDVLRDLVKRDLITPPLRVNFVMGVKGGIPATFKNLLSIYDACQLEECAGQDMSWMVTALGAGELPMSVLAMMMGGDVRVGFEDNIYYKKGEKAKSNAQLVEHISRIAEELDREVATADEARQILGLT
ncbi:MAG TPA: 3-keto-5-aminohexanoate cleavage protein [Candidatus Lokiarchaeia archaeon]|nr:3-keto-5-aminohexanoate cleavage protein [Candidatus Lokiarchaeia archaeon]